MQAERETVEFEFEDLKIIYRRRRFPLVSINVDFQGTIFLEEVTDKNGNIARI